MTFGKFLFQLRDSKRWSQEYLAERAGLRSGASQVSNWEREISLPNLGNFLALASAFNLSGWQLMRKWETAE